MKDNKFKIFEIISIMLIIIIIPKKLCDEIYNEDVSYYHFSMFIFFFLMFMMILMTFMIEMFLKNIHIKK